VGEASDPRDLKALLARRGEALHRIVQWLKNPHPERGSFVVSGGLAVGKSDFLDGLVERIKSDPPREELHIGLVGFGQLASHDLVWGLAEVVDLATEELMAQCDEELAYEITAAFILHFGQPEQAAEMGRRSGPQERRKLVEAWEIDPRDGLMACFIRLFNRAISSFSPENLASAMANPAGPPAYQRLQNFGASLFMLLNRAGQGMPYEGPTFVLVFDDLEFASWEQVGQLLHLGTRIPRCFRLVFCLSQLPQEEGKENFSLRFNPLFKQLAGDNWVNLEFDPEASSLTYQEGERVDVEHYIGELARLPEEGVLIVEALCWAPFAPRASVEELEALTALDRQGVERGLGACLRAGLVVRRQMGYWMVHPGLVEHLRIALAKRWGIEIPSRGKPEHEDRFRQAMEMITGEIAVRLAEGLEENLLIRQDPYLLHNLVINPAAMELVPELVGEVMPGMVWYYYHHREAAIAASLASRFLEGVERGQLKVPAQTSAFVRGVLASSLYLLRRVEQAGEQFDRFIAYCEQVGTERARAAALNRKGSMLLEFRHIQQAQPPLEEALRTYRELEEKAGEAAVLGNLGSLAMLKGELAEAEELFRRSAELARQLGEVQVELNGRLNLGLAYLNQGKTEAARGELVVAQQLADQLRDEHRSAMARFYLGLAAQREGRMQDALDLLGAARESFIRLGDHFHYTSAALHLVELLNRAGHREKALGFAREAVAIAEQINHPAKERLRKLLADLSALDSLDQLPGEVGKA